MQCNRYVPAIFAILAAATAARAARGPELMTLQRLDERAHIATLESDASLIDKMGACRELARVGTAAAVPVLARLLSNEQLSHSARNALEGIPDPAAAAALREALGTLKGKLLAGVIGSCGRKHDERAVDAIARFLDDADADVAYAAAHALGRIGNDAAAAALERSLGLASARPMIAEGYLMCAEAAARSGQTARAMAMYDRLRTVEVPPSTRMAAVYGAIVTRGPAGVELVIQQIHEGSPQMWAVALRAAAEIPGRELTSAMARQIPSLPSEKQVLVIQALGGRRDPAALPAIVAAAKDGAAQVRMAAISALAQFGDASVAPMLFDLAVSEQGDVAAAAQTALASIPGSAVDTALLEKVKPGELKTRLVAMAVLGQRRVAAFTPALIGLVGDADDAIRTAAIRTLGQVATLEQLDILAGALTDPKTPADAQTAEAALAAACARLADSEACAARLTKYMSGARPAARMALVRVLRSVGGAEALAAVRAAQNDPAPEVSDAAVRALCDWTSADAAPDLLAVAQTSPNPTYRVLALRGYINQIRLRSVLVPQKLVMSKEAAALAQRDEEKRLLLGVLGSISHRQALEMTLAYLDQESLRAEACTAAISIATRLARSEPAAVAEAMKKVIAATDDPELIRRAEALANPPAGRGGRRGP